MLNNAPRRLSSRSLRTRQHRSRTNRFRVIARFRRLRHEPLEDRRVLSGITFNDFSDSIGLSLVGDAAIAGGNILRLTPAIGSEEGAAWYAIDKPYVSVNWETTFAFNLNENAGDIGGSDGFTFVVQNYQPTYLAGGGGTLGYYNLPNSLVVEFDTFQNSEVDDPSPSHISVHTNGTDPNSWDETLSIGAYTTPTVIDDATTHTAKISYAPGTLKVFLDDLANPVITASIDLSETLSLDAGRAWVGFTGTTGGGYQNHDILNWYFSSLADTNPVVTVGNAELVEGDAGTTAPMYFPITVTRPDATGPLMVQVDYATADGTATKNSGDYIPATGRLTFSLVDGQIEVTQFVQVTFNGDALAESHETFAVNLSNAVGAIIPAGHGVGTILNDDTRIVVDDVTVVEGDETPAFLDTFVDASDDDGAYANAMTWGPDGQLYVAYQGTDDVWRYDALGNLLGVYVPSNSGGLNNPRGMAFGPDGSLYVVSSDTHSVLRYRGPADIAPGTFMGAFVETGSGGLSSPYRAVFGPDGNLYVSSNGTDSVLRYQGPTGGTPGLFVDAFVPTASGGLDAPTGLAFGPEGDLYVTSCGSSDSILRYEGPSGPNPGQYLEAFIPTSSGGLDEPHDLAFGPDGELYVSGAATDSILRYQGPAGAEPGAFIDASVPATSGGLDDPRALLFDAVDRLYVVSKATDEVLRFGLLSQAIVTVSLTHPSAQSVSVSYTTADNTAHAGSDYTTSTGMITFGRDVTSMVVLVPTLDNVVGESTEQFYVNLSDPDGAVITDGQATVSILDNETKFFVVDDASTNRTFEYGSGGAGVEDYFLAADNTQPRGAASTALGDKVWVVDANKKVYVYNASGELLGSWSLGGLNSRANIQGIATNGTDVWVVDAYADKVYGYAGAANRIDGSPNAASSFSLNKSNRSSTDMVTDGTSLWVVDNSNVDKVFRYTMAGTLDSTWTITTSGAINPTGITIDPANVGHIWIVDNGTTTDRVYQYNNAASLPSGSSKAADAYFALAAGNTNPQGIADPPARGSLLATETAALSEPVSRAPAFSGNDAVLASLYYVPLKKASTALHVRRVAGVESASPQASIRVAGVESASPQQSVRTTDDRRWPKNQHHRQVDVDDLFAEWEVDPLEILGAV